MAPKKSPNRLGSDPFGWIRDTRAEEEEELQSQPVVREAPPAPKAEKPAEPKPKPVAEKPQPSKQQVEKPRVAPAAKASAPAMQQADSVTTEAAIEGAKAALTPQEIKALTMLLAEAKGPAKRGRPRTNFREVTKSSQEGLPENWTRATFIVREAHLETLKDYAYTQRMTIRDALDQALEQYLEDKQVIARRVRGE